MNNKIKTGWVTWLLVFLTLTVTATNVVAASDVMESFHLLIIGVMVAVYIIVYSDAYQHFDDDC